jgi:hypothetical protein
MGYRGGRNHNAASGGANGGGMRKTRPVAEKKEHLVCLDYGKGGVWAFLLAESEEEIRRRLPALIIVHERPPWLDNDEEARIRERMTVDIDDASHSLITAGSADPEPSLPRMCVDFMKPRDGDGRLTLTHVGARRDLAELETGPHDGMRVIGVDQEVLVDGTLRFNQDVNWWVMEFDEDTMRLESGEPL